MVQAMQGVKISRVIGVKPEVAYNAFTSDMGLREWLCDQAYVQPRDGGHLFLDWNSGFSVAGTYEVRQSPSQVAFTWQELGSPEVSRVQVDIAAAESGAHVTITHEGPGANTAQIEKLWTDALEVLQFVLEEGNDIRFTRRPMLGIVVGILDQAAAKRLGLEKPEGVLLETTLPEMGAGAAGLLKDDVILQLGGKETKDFNSLVASLEGKRAGDVVEVVYFRDGKTHSVAMTLSGRPIPEVPPTAAGLADRLEELFAANNAELDEVLKGVTEEEASRRPAENEWSAKEVVAHLAISERNELYLMGSAVAGDEPLAGPGNLPAIYAGFMAAYPTLADARAQLSCAQAELVAFIRALPDDFVARKSTFMRYGQALLQAPFHPRLHYEQIQAAIEAARK